MTFHGCATIRAAADNAAYCILAGVDMLKIDEINLKRCSECVGCPRYTTLSREAFTLYIKEAVKDHIDEIERADLEAEGLVGLDSQKARWKRWYKKHGKTYKRPGVDK
jgi:hypothetical protein